MFALVIFLLTVPAPISASPLMSPRKSLLRRDWSPINSTLTCLFLTNEANWSGEMQNLCEIGGVCASDLPDGLSANVSSAGPTEGQTCFLYSDINCSGDRSDPIVYPGVADLGSIGFDKKAKSWMCWKWCGYSVGASSGLVGGVSTVQPTIGMGASSSAAASSPSVEGLGITASNSPAKGIAEALAITTTLSSAAEESTVAFDITTTLSGSQPSAAVSSSSPSSAPVVANTTSLPAATTPSTSQGTSLAPISSTSFVPTTSININTPGFSMSPSPVTLTHTYADGSTTVVTTFVIEPVPTVPSAPPRRR